MVKQPRQNFLIRLGISSCLLGEKVRYDGGHKESRFLREVLGHHFTWIPVCPEVELGLGIPREPIRLLRHGDEIRFVNMKSGKDYTNGMRNYAERRTKELARANLSGYVLKRGSPSCGMNSVRIYRTNDVTSQSGNGLFADALLKRIPYLPVEEEGRLNTPAVLENFVVRVLTYSKWRQYETSGVTLKSFKHFHHRHKLTVMARNPHAVRRLTDIVAGCNNFMDVQERTSAYIKTFSDIMRRAATRKGHLTVLYFVFESFRKQLDSYQNSQVCKMLNQYAHDALPFSEILRLMRYYVRKFGIECLENQTYLNPEPIELQLRDKSWEMLS